jgi:hypothetical protein
MTPRRHLTLWIVMLVVLCFLGLVGLLVAVLLAAAIGVLFGFAVSRYLQSPFYRGEKCP